MIVQRRLFARVRQKIELPFGSVCGFARIAGPCYCVVLSKDNTITIVRLFVRDLLRCRIGEIETGGNQMKNFKKVLALVLVVAMMMSFVVVASAKAYTDADKIDYKEAVDVLSYIGVLGGYPAGDFRPANEITRAEAAKIIAIFKNGDANISTLYTAANPFTDVKGDWSESYVAYCAQAGIVSGRNATTFDPKANVTGIEFLKMALVVLGFDADAEEFKGANWQVNVLAMAKEAGLLIDGWDPAKAITREEAAQVMLNALEAEKVEYGYKTSLLYPPHIAILTSRAGAYKTGKLLAADWGLTKVTAGVRDIWGRPGYKWTKGAATIGTYYETPVVKYNAAAKNCDILKDLGLKAAKATTVDFLNGTDGGAYTIADNTTAKGAQGRQIEIFKRANGDYEIVEIDTYLAKVAAVSKEKLDANGHVQKEAYLELDVYNAIGSSVKRYVKGNDFAKGEYILVNVNSNTDSIKGCPVDPTYIVEIVGKADSITSAQKGYNLIDETSTYADGTYNWAVKYFLGKVGTNGKTYNLYFDQFGNLIGQEEPTAKYSYGLITAAAWVDSGVPLAPAYAGANLVMLDGSEITGAVLGKFEGKEFAATAYNTTPGDPTADPARLNETVAKNIAYYDHLYQFSVGANGAYSVEDEGTDVTGTVNIKQAVTQLFDTYATNDDTIYLVKTIEGGKAVYNVYEGYKNVPSMGDVKVCYFKDGSYVTMAYIDASAATYVGSQFIAYIADATTDATMGELNGYQMWVDGASSVKYVADKKALTDVVVGSFAPKTPYVVTVNLAGEVTAIEAIDFTDPGYDTVAGVTACDATSITNGTQTWNVTDAEFYAMSLGTGALSAGSTAEVVTKTAYIVLNDAGTAAVAVFYYVA